jgi:hypothetical protein
MQQGENAVRQQVSQRPRTVPQKPGAGVPYHKFLTKGNDYKVVQKTDQNGSLILPSSI